MTDQASMKTYKPEPFAQFVEDLIELAERNPELLTNLTIEEVELLRAFPQQIRTHRFPVICARPTDKIMNLVKFGKIGPVWPSSGTKAQGGSSCK